MSCEVCRGFMCNCPCCGEEDNDRCGGSGPKYDCSGCEDCIRTVWNVRFITARSPRTDKGRARRARLGIKPGDKIKVTTGFDYQINGGPRLRYFRSEALIK